jgi:hypothetical protein
MWPQQKWRIIACGLAIGVGIGITSAYYEMPELSLNNFVYYPNCSFARAIGAAPIHIGESGYRPGLDADNDGIACEPYPALKRGFAG